MSQAVTPEPLMPTQQKAGARSAGDGQLLLRGVVDRLTYRNSETGFAVFRADAHLEGEDEKSGQLTTVVAVVSTDLAPGVSFVARGVWQEHARFGRQFRAYSFTEAAPTSKDALIRYLGSGLIPGWGHSLAEKVIAHFGEKTLSILDSSPEQLLQINGIGKKKLRAFIENWQEKKESREVILFLQQLNISVSLAHRIFKAYGAKAIEIVSSNPYILARDLWGVGFLTADRIARSRGMPLNSKERIFAGLTYSLREAADAGNCFVPQDILLRKAAELLELNESEIKVHLPELGLQGLVIQEQERLYLPHLHFAESSLARRLAMLLAPTASPEPEISLELIERACSNSYLSHSAKGNTNEHNSARVLRLSPQQQQALHLAAKKSLCVITGGPGCGKTTVLRAITTLFRTAGLYVRLAAPTGRAAQRMSEVCGIDASTIHRLLKFDPISREFVHDHANPLKLDALIIDESSMVDLPLANSLFSAIPATARIVIVGDKDQLPSVGPGRVLADLLAIPQMPRVELNTLFRRAEESLITDIAHKINAGTLPHIPSPDGVTKTDAYFLEASDIAQAASLVERVVVEQLPKKFGFGPSDITVLTPMNIGPLGVNELNQKLQDRLVPSREDLPHVRLGNLDFRLGDRVIQRVNNYNIHDNGVFNGDQGEIIGIEAESAKAVIRIWDGREIDYTAEDLAQLGLAYVLTIHRSQGSEVPAVVLLLHDSHHIMLERQLIYTAVTRAKKLLIIIGTRSALATATKRTRSTRRYTSLVWRTSEALA